MYVKRQVQTEVVRLFSEYPVVTITGPRQSGKSTMCKELFPELPYISLEDIDNRTFAAEDPRGFLKRCGKQAVIDEVQRVPELLSYIQTRVDESGINGQFILTGSRQFELMEAVTQSLAGRTALVRLLPFSLNEITACEKKNELSINYTLFRGFYPRIVVEEQNPAEAYSFYISTYVERDVRRVLKIQNLRLFEVFLKVCAGRTGQLLNFSEIANEVGIDLKTVQRWLSVLEAGYIVKIVTPYFKNLNKRLTKMPKVYFYDTGLVCYLLGIRKPEHLTGHPLFGGLFETYVVGELLKKAYNHIENDDLYFFRDNRGREVDIIHDRVNSVDIMEIKSSSTFNSSFLKGLNYISTLPVEIHSSHVVYGGNESYIREGVNITGWKDIPGF
jgi:hypothetical protein